MIEQQVEKRVLDILSAALETAGVDGIAAFGAWQVADEGAAKDVETAADGGIMSVKVEPRQYATPTVPHATLAATVALTLRAETDPRGLSRLAIADALLSVLYSWQDSFAAFAADFSGIDGFRPCGFALSGGDVGLDRNAAAWTFSQSFTINAILTTPTKGE